MLRACYLGWQGWLVQSDDVCILIDPLLVDDVGRGGPGRCQPPFVFWPPRAFDWSKLPPVDAVFYTHEHEDHFNVASLARMSRDIPVLASGRMSGAAKTILEEMGFEPRFVRAGESVTIGDLELGTFPPNLVTDWAAADHDEWDVLAFFVRQTGGDGVFFSNVDVEATQPMAEGVLAASKASGEPVSVVQFSRMTVSVWSMPTDFTPRVIDNQHAPPEGVEHVEDSEKALEALKSGGGFQPLAGQCVVLEKGAVARVERKTDFLWTDDRPWPDRPSFFPKTEDKIAPPVTGQTDLDPAKLPELEQHLLSLAEYLYGRKLFKELNSLSQQEIGERMPTFMLALVLNGNLDAKPYMYESDPLHVPPDRRAAGAAGSDVRGSGLGLGHGSARHVQR